jgi:hypothetical protein
LAFGACTGVTSISAPSAQNTSSKLRANLASRSQHKAQPLSLFAEHLQQVAGLLGDPQTVGVGGHPGQVDPSGVQLDEEQHVQPLQPHGVDSEEVAGEDPGGLLAQERLPGRRGPARGRVQSMTAEGAADRGCRDPHPEAQQFSLDALVAPAGVLLGEADDELLDLRVEGGRPGPRRG